MTRTRTDKMYVHFNVMCNNAHTDLLQDFTVVLISFSGQFQTHLAAYAISVIQAFLMSLYL